MKVTLAAVAGVIVGGLVSHLITLFMAVLITYKDPQWWTRYVAQATKRWGK